MKALSCVQKRHFGYMKSSKSVTNCDVEIEKRQIVTICLKLKIAR